MALLSEYAITPDVFNSKAHENEEVARERFLNLKDILLEEGLVRDLCDGAWAKLFSNPQAQFHPRGKELVKKLNEKMERVRINLRQARESVKNVIEGAFEEKNISEDDKFRFIKELDEYSAKKNEELKEIRDKKEKDIMEI